jgi:hypothetical protein
MTADTVPTDPSVLNTTVLSNFAAIDRIDLVADLAGILPPPKSNTNSTPAFRPTRTSDLPSTHSTTPFRSHTSLKRSQTAKTSSEITSIQAKHKRSHSQTPTTAVC